MAPKRKQKSISKSSSSTTSSLSSSWNAKQQRKAKKLKRAKRNKKVSSSGTSSSPPSTSKIRRGKSHKKKMKPRKRLQINLQEPRDDQEEEEDESPQGPSSSPLSDPPPSSSNSQSTIQRRRREVAIQRQQPRRFPLNPSQADIDEWLQKDTENPWVKLSRKHIKRMRPTANIYLKQANFNPANNRITRLLPGGTLARNEYPVYIMLTPINAPRRFSVQLDRNHLYIRKLQKDKITDEYEKEKLWNAVQEEISDTQTLS